ncbi:hypothetical protein B7759_06036 (plasmid) [Burkholderia glumae]|uniref:hypothetical protein n=1 Tax=Burkholderia glumae TaxID=337 RepID=UPI001BB5C413|nr:hypothetical protein [Burkholderia glumae]QTP37393.1 hypothetical protein B7759_06036 [Burkholderia glumae]
MNRPLSHFARALEARVNYAYATCTTDRGSAAWHTYLITAREHAMALGRMHALDPADLCECPRCSATCRCCELPLTRR